MDLHDVANQFTHLFGGWKEAQARRWTNPDGGVGGIVAVDAVVPDETFIPAESVVWPGASIGDRAFIGGGASIGGGDWWLSGGPCGSRSAFWTAVFSAEHGLRWWVGCQHGISTEHLRDRVADQHRSSEHTADYLHSISFVESHPGLARARAAAEEKRGAA